MIPMTHFAMMTVLEWTRNNQCVQMCSVLSPASLILISMFVSFREWARDSPTLLWTRMEQIRIYCNHLNLESVRILLWMCWKSRERKPSCPAQSSHSLKIPLQLRHLIEPSGHSLLLAQQNKSFVPNMCENLTNRRMKRIQPFY